MIKLRWVTFLPDCPLLRRIKVPIYYDWNQKRQEDICYGDRLVFNTLCVCVVILLCLVSFVSLNLFGFWVYNFGSPSLKLLLFTHFPKFLFHQLYFPDSVFVRLFVFDTYFLLMEFTTKFFGKFLFGKILSYTVL